MNITINGKAVWANPGETILEVARREGIKVPTLCYLKDMTPTGSCRICVAENIETGQLIPSCAYPVTEGLNVSTNSPKVRRSRKTIIELLIAPAVRVALGEEFGMDPGSIVTGKVVAALRRLGIEVVFDTNFGADMTIIEEATELIHRIQNEEVLPMITSCSPGWVKYLEHFYPDLLPHLSTCKSPHEMEGALIKSFYARKLGVDPELYAAYLKRSLERSRSMRDMINALLNIYRLESTQRVKMTEIVDVSEVLTETLHLFETDITRQDVKVMTKLSGNLLTEADREDIQRVFSNLISNAVKYNHFGGEIYIWGHQEGNYICISIQDTGIGMIDTEQHRLFESFFRAKNTYTRNVSGTGLGLSTVKRIMDDLAGKISVESQFQKGTKFTLCFPAPTCHLSL